LQHAGDSSDVEQVPVQRGMKGSPTKHLIESGSREKHGLREGRGRHAKIEIVNEEISTRVRVNQKTISPAHYVHELGRLLQVFR